MTAFDVLAAGAAQGALQCFASVQGVTLRGHFGPVGGNRARLLAGEPCDIVILTGTMIDELMASGHVVAGTRRDLGRVATAIAVMAGTPHPSVSNSEGLRKTLAGASAIFIPDPAQATAGAHAVKILEGLGLGEVLAARLRVHPGGMKAMAALAASGAKGAIGCTQVTEILATPGIELVAPLPTPHDLVTTYAAGVAVHSPRQAEARDFIEAFCDGAGRNIRIAAGFDCAA